MHISTIRHTQAETYKDAPLIRNVAANSMRLLKSGATINPAETTWHMIINANN